MIRTLILLSCCAVSLTGCKDFTSGTATVEAFIRGNPDPAFVETVAVEQPSSLEVVTVAEPEPPCVPGTSTFMNRFMLYDSCTLELIGPDPRYW